MYRQILLAIIGALLGLGMILAYRYELLGSVEVKKLKIENGIFIYRSIQTNYDNMLEHFTDLKKKFKGYLKPGCETIKYFGFYYDAPILLIDKNKGRASIGLFLDSEKKGFDLERFLKDNLDFKMIETDGFDAFGCIFPLYDSLNMYFNIVRGYALISKYGKKNDLRKDLTYSFETYDYNGKKMLISFPIGEEAKKYQGLSGFAIPCYKEDGTKQKDE